jgi:hypothetical protein
MVIAADIPGAVQRGLQFRQAAQLRPGALQSQQFGLQRQEQQLQTGALQQQRTQQGIETEQQRAKSQGLFNTVARLRTLPDAQKGAFLEQNIIDIESRPDGDATESRQALALTQQGNFQELNEGLDNLFQAGVNTGFLKADARTFVPSGIQEFESLTKGLTPEQKNEATLIKLGINPRAVSSADITIAESPVLTEQVAKSKEIIKQRTKFAEKTGASRAVTIDKGFERIAKIDAGLRNIDRAIDALNKGAGVGAVERFFPSFKASSVELDNIRKSMGLDVVGGVTFGALSKGELDLALDVALPTGLDTPELIEFLQNKKASQEKLRAYFNEQIQFLDQGGTVAGFLRQKESQQGATQQPVTEVPGVSQPQVTATFNSVALGREISEQDIIDTLQANPSLTREQLFQQLGIQQ